MSGYTWATISAPGDYDQLSGMLDEAFQPVKVAETLKDGISPAVRGMLVESGYVDKDYRSTYYNFYAKKGRSYRSDCVRLHFFGDCILDKRRLSA